MRSYTIQSEIVKDQDGTLCAHAKLFLREFGYDCVCELMDTFTPEEGDFITLVMHTDAPDELMNQVEASTNTVVVGEIT